MTNPALSVLSMLAMLLLVGCGGGDNPPGDVHVASPTPAAGEAADAKTGDSPATTPKSTTESEPDGEISVDLPDDGGDGVALPAEEKKLVKTDRRDDYFLDPKTGQPTKKVQAFTTVKVFSDNTFVPHGKFAERNEDNKMIVDGQYVEGIRDGEWKYYHDNGQLAKTVIYNNGKENGQWTVYREDGSPDLFRSYKNGLRDGQWFSYDPKTKKPDAQQEYKEGQPHGDWIWWYPSGQMQAESHFVDGKLHGPRTFWHENGQVKETMTYEENRLVGKSAVFDEDGRKISETDYSADTGKSGGGV